MDRFVRASVVFTRERVTEQPDKTDNRLLAEERQKQKTLEHNCRTGKNRRATASKVEGSYRAEKAHSEVGLAVMLSNRSLT